LAETVTPKLVYLLVDDDGEESIEQYMFEWSFEETVEMLEMLETLFGP
jgi:hypothetical protein